MTEQTQEAIAEKTTEVEALEENREERNQRWLITRDRLQEEYGSSEDDANRAADEELGFQWEEEIAEPAMDIEITEQTAAIGLSEEITEEEMVKGEMAREAAESEEELMPSDEAQELIDANIAAILDGGEADEETTALDLSMKDLKLAIRGGQFSEGELEAIIKEKIISREVVDVLLQHPVGAAANGKEEAVEAEEGTEELQVVGMNQAAKEAVKKAPPQKKTVKKQQASATGQVTARIQKMLIDSATGLTIEEICVNLGVITDDADSTDSDTKGIKKKYRTFARKAVDSHADGSRQDNLGRNRLYSIGDVEDRELEEVVPD